MAPNNPSGTASNVAGPSSNPAQILTQMQSRIEQLEGQRRQQQLKTGKPDQFDGTKEKLRQWLAQMDVHLSAQSYQLGTEGDKVMLAISYLTGKAADWIQPYINRKFHSEEEEDEMFSSYEKFVEKIIAAFGPVDPKREAERKLEHLRQKGSTSNYAADFRQIASVLDWDDEAYVSLFYRGLKDGVKDELAKIEWPDDLDDMVTIAVRIDNRLWERQQEK